MKGFALIRDCEDYGYYDETLPFRLLRSESAAVRQAHAALNADDQLTAVVLCEYDDNGRFVSSRFIRRKRTDHS